MKTIIITKGLPASGKTTWAKARVTSNPGQYKRVNKDDLREMLDSGHWSKGNERFILKLRDQIVVQALSEGKHVIVDDTNLHPKHEKAMRDIAKGFTNTKVEVKDFTDVDVQECIRRDLKRPNSVGAKVITDMYNSFISDKRVQDAIPYDDKLEDCYIFDVDGTLALMGDRSPYDWDKVDGDTVNPAVHRVYKSITASNPFARIIILTGRDGVCEVDTRQWLVNNGVTFDEFFIRPKSDTRKDSIIKKEIYETRIKDKYNVLGIFDDRNQVVEMWRSLGLPVFQVADGNF